MGMLRWLFGGKKSGDEEDHGVSVGESSEGEYEDSEEDRNWIGPLAERRERECAVNPTPYGEGQAEARFRIDDMRRYYHQYGYSSFQEALHVTGNYWHQMVQSEQALIDQGYTERQAHLDFARGNRSMYD